MYTNSANLYINGETIESSEGSTQGDPLAMVMYPIGGMLMTALGVVVSLIYISGGLTWLIQALTLVIF